MAATPPSAEVVEPLELSAPLARRLAPELCRRDPATGESCAWYHGFWQDLRLAGMGTSPAGHATFFREAFARLPIRRAAVLIAGGADYSMLAHAAAACRAHGVEPQFTMVDWCETPLALSRWYAARESIGLTTLRHDLLDAGQEAAFDAVCTHALLGHFPPEQRPRLVSNLARALRPGGRLVLANRLRPGAGADQPAKFSAAQIEEFIATLRRRQEERNLPGTPVEAARSYAERQISWPVRSTDEVGALCESAGLQVEHLSSAPMQASGPGLNVPTVPGGADYARLVAIRP